MEVLAIEEILEYLRSKKNFFYEKFGVTRMGIFGSFVQNTQTPLSDIDIAIEMQTEKKNIHNFLELKRFLEQELSIKVDIGFESALKPIIKNKIKEKIIYV